MTRRQVVVLGCLAALVLLLYGGAVAAGTGDGDPEKDRDRWAARLHRFRGQEVAVAQLQVQPACSLDPPTSTLSFVGACVLQAPRAGRLSLTGASRRLSLTTVAGGVRLHTTVRGNDVDGDVPHDKAGTVSFGRAGATVTLLCTAAPCRVRLGD